MKFNKFCHEVLDGLYNPGLPMSEQCTGYYKLREMLMNNITPHSLQEIERWENNPTTEDLNSIPDIRYMRFLHPILRRFIVENWLLIINKVELEEYKP